MRIVLDTNVLLAGMGTRGVCEALLNLCFNSSEHTVIISEYLLDEFARHYEETFGMSVQQTRTAVEYLRENAELVAPVDVESDACRDASDLPILGTGIAGKADCLVTGDRDLLVLGTFRGLSILPPRTLYERLR